MSPELALPEQVKDVVGIVGLVLAQPAVAVVPFANRVPVQSFQFGGKYRIQILIGIAANRCQGWVETNVVEIVETRGKAVLGKHRDAGHEHEADVFLSTLQDAVDFSKTIPVCTGLVVIFQHIQHRLVVFIDQYHDLLTGRLVQAGQNTPKPVGRIRDWRQGFEIERQHGLVQLVKHVFLQGPGRADCSIQGQANHRMLDRPVPVRVNVQAPKQGLIALEQFLQGIDQQTLAETAGAKEKAVPPLIDHLPDQRRFIHIINSLSLEVCEMIQAQAVADGDLFVFFHS